MRFVSLGGLKDVGLGLLDVVYPPLCGVCGVGLEGADRGWCWDCRSGVGFIVSPFCRRCGLPAAGVVEHDYCCHSCGKQVPRFAVARSVGRFDGSLREAIHAFKYEGALWLEPGLSDLLYGGLLAHYDVGRVDGVVPVPLFRGRLRRRGYNQALLLARGLARRSGLACYEGVLLRVRDTRSQVGLTFAQRRMNMRGAFGCFSGGRLEGQTILLVDDVMTTSATSDECADALLKGGAKTVLVLTLARG